MKSVFCYIICTLRITNISKANDSTELYKRRVEKLKVFSTWLFKNANDDNIIEGIYYQYDSAANKNWKVFDTAIELFYNKKIVDSVIENREGKDNIFLPVEKLRMIKGLLARFNALSHRIDFDSLKFRPESSNEISQYFIIDGQIILYLGFTFEKEKTKLTFINVSEPQGEKGKRFYMYYQNLKRNL